MPDLTQFLVFVQKSPFNMMLLGLAVTTGGMLVWPLITRAWRKTSEVGTFEAVQLINRRDALVLDVRDTGEFAAGHLGSAKHIPEAQLTERMKELEKFKSRPIIIADRSGIRAPAVAGALRKNGFAEVFGLKGGVAAWQQAGLPLEK